MMKKMIRLAGLFGIIAIFLVHTVPVMDAYGNEPDAGDAIVRAQRVISELESVYCVFVPLRQSE